MALINKRITPGEIAAVYYHVFGGCDDWVLLYAIADGIKDKQVYDINRNTVSKWKGMDKITGLIARLKQERERIGGNDRGDSERTETAASLKNSKLVDYGDPVNQARKLNELVNSADDPGEALDALKVIISTQKADREAARDNKTVRAYVPITCSDCPLYSRAKNKLSK